MQLSDFFSPLNFYNLPIFFIAFIIFDAIGIRIASFLKSPIYLRTIFWVWGLAIFIFIWFLLHLFLPFWPIYVWVSLIISGFIVLPGYINRKEIISLFREVIIFPFPLLILLIIAKPVYFLVSAPPFYTDELAYHFYSPALLITEKSWPFLSGASLYQMVPKFLDTSFIVMFSLSKTYATARLLHFLLVFSAIYAIGKYLKQNINLFAAIAYSFLVLLISPVFLTSATQGYVDAGAAIFSILFLIAFVDFIVKKEKKYLFAAYIIFGITIGIKYTVLAFLGSVILIGIGFLANYRKILAPALNLSPKHKSNFHFSTIAIGSILIVLFGGYWYVKNIIMTGNPVYPFLFKCYKGIKCQTGYDYFASWAIPLDSQHYPLIRSIIFQNSNLLVAATFASLLFAIIAAIILKLDITKILAFIIPVSVLLEIFISKNTSGFELRYFYHWVLLIPLSLALPFAILTKNKLPSNGFKILLGLIIFFFFLLSVGPVVKNNIKRLYEPDFVPGYIRNYTMRRINLYQWIDYYAPETNEIIKWCGEKRPMQNLLVVDPSLIWSGYELHAFMVNCTLNIIGPAPSTNIDEYVKEIRKKYNNSYLVSLNRCGAQKPDLTFQPGADLLARHELNMKLICNSKEVFKNVYILSKQ
jgi:hypothetical protein